MQFSWPLLNTLYGVNWQSVSNEHIVYLFKNVTSPEKLFYHFSINILYFIFIYLFFLFKIIFCNAWTEKFNLSEMNYVFFFFFVWNINLQTSRTEALIFLYTIKKAFHKKKFSFPEKKNEVSIFLNIIIKIFSTRFFFLVEKRSYKFFTRSSFGIRTECLLSMSF